MKFTIKILIQFLVGLFLVVSASAAGNAGQALLVDIEKTVLETTVQAPASDKLKAPERQQDRCNQVTTYAPASSRPRAPYLPDTSDLSETRELRVQNPVRMTTDIGHAFELGPVSRRSPFWQVFAYSARFRR